MRPRTVNKDINALKAIAIFLVIFGHSIDEAGHFGELPLVESLFTEIVYSVHVPLFFLVAGYLVRAQKPLPYLLKKLRYILVPALFFSSLKAFYLIFVAGEVSPGAALWEYLRGVYLMGTHYWFAYAILLMFFLSPLLWNKSKRGTAILIAVLVLLLAVDVIDGFHSVVPRIYYLQLYNTIQSLPWFLLGMLSRRIALRDKTKFDRIAACVSAAVLLFIIIGQCGEWFAYRYWVKLLVSLSVSYILAFLVSYVPKNQIFELGARYSLQIMFLDSFYKFILYRVFIRFLPLGVFLVLLMTLLDFGLAILTCLVAERIPVVRTLFGLKAPTGPVPVPEEIHS